MIFFSTMLVLFIRGLTAALLLTKLIHVLDMRDGHVVCELWM